LVYFSCANRRKVTWTSAVHVNFSVFLILPVPDDRIVSRRNVNTPSTHDLPPVLIPHTNVNEITSLGLTTWFQVH
jgi:hypothetical protein